MTVKIHNRSGGLLAEYDVENIRDAYLRGAYLVGAYLVGAYLRGADLRGAYLRGANLTGAYLRGANLTDANLRGVNLTDADLRGADLSGADLRGADLRGADLSGANLIIITWMHRTVYITTGHIRIGCQAHSLNDWKNFTDDQISEMDSKALNFWKENKELIVGLCERLPEKK
jgi:hypothetical protein